MRLITLADGATLPCADDGAGPPILLVHGWAAQGSFFDALRARLSAYHRVLVPTLRGHDGAGAGARPLTIETLSDDIAELAEQLDLQNLVALGWSMGAMTIWAAAARLEGRLAGIVVEEMGPKLVNDEAWRCGLAGPYLAADVAGTLAEIRADWPAYVTRFAPRMFAPATRASNPDLVSWAAQAMTRSDPEAMAEIWASMSAQDFRGALAEIDAPVLVVHGGQSQIYPDCATRYVASESREGARVSMRGVGHVPHLEAPDVFFDHVATFARQAQSRADL